MEAAERRMRQPPPRGGQLAHGAAYGGPSDRPVTTRAPLQESALQARTDRIIAVARLAIAAFALVVVWLATDQPLRAPGLTYAVLVSYVTFSAATALALRRRALGTDRIALAAHLVDLGVISLLVYATGGAMSPFFLLFTFAILTPTFRWHWKGTLWTSVAVLAVLLSFMAGHAQLDPDTPFEFDRFLIRSAQVVMLGAFLAFFGYHQQRMVAEMSRLTSWHADPLASGDGATFLETCAGHAAQVFGAPRVLLVVSDPEEPCAVAGYWHDGTFRRDRLQPGQFAGMVPPPLAGMSFISEGGTVPVLTLSDKGHLGSWSGDSVGAELRKAYSIDRALSVPVRGERIHGRLFVLDRPDLSAEDLIIASVVAAQMSAALERAKTVDALRRSSAAEERLHLARDLHDGFLQTLAGVALQLEGLARLIERESASAPARMRELQDWLLEEQRELRAFIDALHASQMGDVLSEADFRSSLHGLAASLQQRWDMKIAISIKAPDLYLTGEMQRHMYQMLREAAANAARHGRASWMSIGITGDERGLALDITDGGCGLPTHGAFDQDQCAAVGIGPRSLRERVLELGGSFALHSAPSGLTLRITLPLALAERRANDDSPRRR